MRKAHFFLAVLVLSASTLFAQQKQITLEDIYRKGTFRAEVVPAIFDSTKKESEPQWKGLTDANGKPFGQPDESIASPTDNKLFLLRKGTESIYRR